MFVCNRAPRSYVVVALVLGVLLINSPLSEGKRSLGGGGRKTSSSSGGYSTRRQPQTSQTKPTYNTNSGNSHAENTKLSYPNYNSQPNRPANAAPPQNTQQQPIGWNVQNQGHAAGPPPAYSPSNVAGGAKTNMHEPPPVYNKPNYAAPPPNYAQATGTQYGQMPAGATYHSPSNLPPGATYYNNPSHVPGYGGGYPAGGSYPMQGGYHPGGSYPMQGGYHAPAGVPAGATYFPAGGALPPGAVMMPSPPQQTSSGLGFGSGLAAGAIGGAILGHVLTPSHSGGSYSPAPAPVAGNAAGGDRIIIINSNGEPVNATTVNGATVINTGGPAAPAAAPNADTGAPAPLAPMMPLPNGMTTPQNMTSDANAMPAAVNPAEPMPNAGMPANATDNAPVMNPEQQPPAPGGIICVPVRVNDTDPADATKMIEVEKVACYPAPPPPPPPAAVPGTVDANNTLVPPQTPADGSAPLAPIQPVVGGSQQLQQATGDQNAKQASSGSARNYGLESLIVCFLASYLVAN